MSQEFFSLVLRHDLGTVSSASRVVFSLLKSGSNDTNAIEDRPDYLVARDAVRFVGLFDF